MNDLTTENGYRNYLNDLFRITGEILAKDGQLTPVAHIAVRINPETGELMKAPGILTAVCTDMNSEEEKDAWVRAIRELCSKTNAVGCVVVNEAWMVTASTDEMKHGKVSGLPPSKHPNRVEVVIAIVEHIKFGREMWIAQMIRDGDKVSLGEFQNQFGDGSEKPGVSGRFTQFIPQMTMN